MFEWEREYVRGRVHTISLSLVLLEDLILWKLCKVLRNYNIFSIIYEANLFMAHKFFMNFKN